MTYCIDENADEPIMLLNKEVGDGGIEGSLFQSELLYLDTLGKKRIQVWINSPGGVVMDGYNIYNAILKSKTKVDTYCVGIAASIAAVIFQAGRTRYISDYGRLMYHEAHGGVGKQLEVMNTSIATMVASRSGKTEDEILSAMKRTTWMTADEALVNGFADSIEVSSDHNKKRMVGEPKEDLAEPEQAKALWTNCNKILNSIFSEIKFPKTKTMTKVTNKLGLNQDASEESILSAIAEIENKLSANVKNSADAIAKLENEIAEKNKEKESLECSLNEFKKKAEEEEAAKNEAVAKAEDEKVTNMLSEFVKVGKIKNESVEEWTATSKAIGFEKAKAILEALPLNKVSNKIEDSPVTLKAGELPTSAVSLMARIQNNLKK